jgi:hypothetical protein
MPSILPGYKPNSFKLPLQGFYFHMADTDMQDLVAGHCLFKLGFRNRAQDSIRFQFIIRLKIFDGLMRNGPKDSIRFSGIIPELF